MPRITTTLLFTIAAAVLMLPAGLKAAPETPVRGIGEWATVTDARSRTEIAYPGSVFTQKTSPADAEGKVFVSRDGGARLLVGWFTNEGEASLSAYRTQILHENYRDAELDYAPSGKGWFVLSGTMGTTMFYERVSFTCGGRYINTWAMLYPAAERKFYDRVVEAIAPTFQPGRGAGGRCE